MTDILKRIKEFLLPETDSNFRTETAKINFRSLTMISLIGGIIEAIGLVLLFATDWNGVNTSRSIKSLTFGFLFCVVFQINLRLLKRNHSSDYKIVNFETLLLFAAMAVWGLFVSYNHYINSTQMLTFYAVIVCMICTLVIRPIYSIAMVTMSFGTLLFLIYRFDGAKNINVFNFSALMLLCIFGSISKYKNTSAFLNSRAEVTALNEKLRLAARTDITADIQNRYALSSDYIGHTGKDTVLCVCDINRFKHFNDKYGHAIGDEIIKATAGVLKNEFGSDTVYRYGGDEFVLVDDTELGLFEDRLERVKSALGRLTIDGVEEKITCSFGVAQSNVSSRDDFDKLFREADSKMYAEKKADSNNQ